MKLFGRLADFYKQRIKQLILYCKNLDNQKTAFAIAASFCIGITPLFGFTLILVTTFGLIFRLNQVIMQSVHIMVTPLQVILYPFMQVGKFAFGIKEGLPITSSELPGYFRNHTADFLQNYLGIFLAGTVSWAIVSIVAGCLLFKIILFYLNKGSDVAIEDTAGLKV
ncbi:MAG: DUF2062 domain-containing protein [Bacteroidales bacterium]|nr:DUF2062 domain-containing protein [Bacteroidales bacterium]